MNLTGVGSYRIDFTFRQCIVVCSIAEVKHTRITVFEIKDDLGAFAELDFRGCRNFCACNGCGNGTFGNTAVACGKVKAVDRADGFIFKCKLNIVYIEFDCIESMSCC